MATDEIVQELQPNTELLTSILHHVVEINTKISLYDNKIIQLEEDINEMRLLQKKALENKKPFWIRMFGAK